MLTHKSQRHLKAPITDSYEMTHNYAELKSDRIGIFVFCSTVLWV